MRYNKITILLGTLFVSLLLTGCNQEKRNIVYLDNILTYKLKEEANSKNEDKEGSINDKWYYSQLTSEKDREIYDEIYQALLNKEASIELNLGDTEKLKLLFKSCLYDKPQIYYV